MYLIRFREADLNSIAISLVLISGSETHELIMTSDTSTSKIAVSFVFPCLNESATIGNCIDEVNRSLRQCERPFEIIVADNGSTDDSAEIARERGAKIVQVPEPGYGAALRGGFEAARGKWILFADADGTYPYDQSSHLLETSIKHEYQLLLGIRRDHGKPSLGIPWLHRRIGTPVLSMLINRLHGTSITDCNTGFRCVSREALTKWQLRANGMEFASEMIIKAMKGGSKIGELSLGFRGETGVRQSHLRTWRDGWRHLKLIVSESASCYKHRL